MRITVTGGAGFIGSAVVREALKRGHEVVVLDDLSTGYRSNLDGLERVTLIEADVRDGEAVARALDGSDGVFHLAASVGNVRSIEEPFHDMAINAGGTLTLLEQMCAAGIDRLVYSSSAATYGEATALPVPETACAEPDSPYGVSKLAGEKYCLAYGRLYGWSTACLRYFNVYGERQRFDAYGNVIPIFARRLLRGEELVIFGDGEQTRDFVNVTDVARANLSAFEGRATGAFNVGSGSRVTVNRLVELMLALSGGAGSCRHDPPRAGEVRDSQADISAAGAFGYAPEVDLEDGLRSYLAWFAEDAVSGPTVTTS